MERQGRSRFWYLVILAVILYVLMSAAIAVATSDKCGDLNSDKEWSFVPPKWECMQ